MSGSNTKRIWIITELYWPSSTSTAHILGQIANWLNTQYEVCVLTNFKAIKFYDIIDLDKQNRRDEKIIDINAPFSKNIFLRLILGFIFTIKVIKFLRRNCKETDQILAVTNPQTLILFLPLFFRKNLTFLIHDVFPDNLIRTGSFLTRLIGKFLLPFYNFSYKKLRNAIVLGSDMMQLISSKNVQNVTIIRNWPDDDILVYPFPKGKIKILYAGNVGTLQGIDKFVHFFKNLDPLEFELTIQGEGFAKSDLIKFCSENYFDNVIFKDSFKRNEQSSIYKDYHFCLVTLNTKMFGLGVPSKFYNVIKAGRPVIYLGPSDTEISNSIIKYQLGYIVDDNKYVPKIEEEIKAIIQLKPPKYYSDISEIHFSTDKVRSEFLKYFNNAFKF